MLHCRPPCQNLRPSFAIESALVDDYRSHSCCTLAMGHTATASGNLTRSWHYFTLVGLVALVTAFLPEPSGIMGAGSPGAA